MTKPEPSELTLRGHAVAVLVVEEIVEEFLEGRALGAGRAGVPGLSLRSLSVWVVEMLTTEFLQAFGDVGDGSRGRAHAAGAAPRREQREGGRQQPRTGEDFAMIAKLWHRRALYRIRQDRTKSMRLRPKLAAVPATRRGRRRRPPRPGQAQGRLWHLCRRCQDFAAETGRECPEQSLNDKNQAQSDGKIAHAPQLWLKDDDASAEDSASVRGRT